MRLLAFIIATTIASFANMPVHAQDNSWRVSKVSGDVMLVAQSSAPATLTNDAVINAGDSIRTGRNGRVLLVRGEETILVSPNSAISVPQAQKEGLSTTIAQQAGSILLKVEKRNVRHFEVETPYLAAVVKGTQFSVTVDAAGAHVDVREGSVEVADMKTGQFALVLPGQAARVGARGTEGLMLSGAGQLNPVQRGEPRKSNVEPFNGARAGLQGPTLASASASTRILANTPGGPRIAAPIGAVKLDIHAVTRGMARASSEASSPNDRRNKNDTTIWNSGRTEQGSAAAASHGNGIGGGNGASASNGGGSGANNGNAFGNGNGNAYAGSNGKGKGKGKS